MHSNPETITIDSLAYGGDAVGHINGRVIFVPGGIPGDEISITIDEDRGSFLKGTIQKILSPSTERVEPFCPFAERCGGCQWQDVAYPAQLYWKHKIVSETLHRIGKLSMISVEPCIPAPFDRGYRSIARYPSQKSGNKLKWGYYERQSHNLVDIDCCPIASVKVNEISSHVRTILLKQKHIPDVREITIKTSYNHPSALVSITTRDSYDFTESAGQLLSEINTLNGISIWSKNKSGRPECKQTFGARHRYEILSGHMFRIGERSFFQINTAQTEQMITLIKEMIHPEAGQKVVDGYGGVGLFSLSIFPENTSIYLFDSSKRAVADSRFNADALGFTGFTAYRENAERAFNHISGADILIIDPPRTGLGKKTVRAACNINARTIIYISCNPATLARDLAVFCEGGYRVERIVPFDMFPHTYHLETVVKMGKG